MKKFGMIILSLSVFIGNSFGQDPIQFHCKSVYENEFNKTSGIFMSKLSKLEVIKGAFYEAIMGETEYYEAMKKTYEQIREENKYDEVYQRTFNFDKFETPINEIVRSINKKSKDKMVSYNEIVNLLLEHKDDAVFCPDNRVITKKEFKNKILSKLVK